MDIDMTQMGSYLQAHRRMKQLTQAELAERLDVSIQAVSNWERGESIPETLTLFRLSRILGTSVDLILGGGNTQWQFRRTIRVSQIREALDSLRKIRDCLGHDHFMYRAMIEGLNTQMHSDIESAFERDTVYTAYLCELTLGCVRNGDYIEINDLKATIPDCRALDYTIKALREMEIE